MTSKFQYLSQQFILSRRYQRLLLSENYNDCSFKVDQKVFKCHKLILSAASPVFEAMFYGPMSQETEIRILDISPDTFQLLIEYIYTCDINFEQQSLETLIELYYSGEKYILPDLVRNCLEAIREKLRYQNILPAIDLSFYMNLQPLLQTCILFFKKYCLDEYQFFREIKTNYYHIAKKCLKFVAQLSLDSKHLPCFVKEWCQQECKSLGLTECDYKLVYNDLELPNHIKDSETIISDQNCTLQKRFYGGCNYIERVYYKACRPFEVHEGFNEFNVTVKTDRFISLAGIVISSRLMPQVTAPCDTSISYDQEYCENLELEIMCDNEIIHEQSIEQKVNYNCDVNIYLSRNVTLTPNLEYRIRFLWDQSAHGAEYPCALYSMEARGVKFMDLNMGTILKGIKYSNL